jgi:HEAT repeat protein
MPERLRRESLERIARFDVASPVAVATVHGMLGDPRTAPEILGAALRAAAALHHLEGDAAALSALTGALIDSERNARGADRFEDWIEALGECGRPETVPALRRVAAEADERMRDAAVLALGAIAGAAATDALAERASLDGSPLVRLSAVELLAERADARDRLHRIVGSESHETVRISALLALRPFLSEETGDAAIRDLVERLAAGDPSTAVRDTAARLLKG